MLPIPKAKEVKYFHKSGCKVTCLEKNISKPSKAVHCTKASVSK